MIFISLSDIISLNWVAETLQSLPTLQRFTPGPIMFVIYLLCFWHHSERHVTVLRVILNLKKWDWQYILSGSICRSCSCTLFPNIYRKINCITKTYLYNFDPLKPNFYIVKLGFLGVYIIFLISAQKHRLWVLVRTASPSTHNLCFDQKYEKYPNFYLIFFIFLVVKLFSILE